MRNKADQKVEFFVSQELFSPELDLLGKVENYFHAVKRFYTCVMKVYLVLLFP